MTHAGCTSATIVEGFTSPVDAAHFLSGHFDFYNGHFDLDAADTLPHAADTLTKTV